MEDNRKNRPKYFGKAKTMNSFSNQDGHLMARDATGQYYGEPEKWDFSEHNCVSILAPCLKNARIEYRGLLMSQSELIYRRFDGSGVYQISYQTPTGYGQGLVQNNPVRTFFPPPTPEQISQPPAQVDSAAPHDQLQGNRQTKMVPVLKWPGGKTQLLNQIKDSIPFEYKKYFEPFLGGGAVLLGVSPAHAFLNDKNEQLVNVYLQIKVAAEDVIAIVNELDSIPCTRELFHAIRERYNTKITGRIFDPECASLMIWLNKHCFNGLYRVNKKGLFNVPYNGKVGGKSIDESNIRAISEYLNNEDISISCFDFEKACDGVESGDFVYFDSPYVPESVTASFTEYTKDAFSMDDHERLAALFRRLDKVGAKVMLSNNDVPLVRSLYQGYYIQSLNVKRMINRNASKRTGKEVIITNYSVDSHRNHFSKMISEVHRPDGVSVA